jgi:hypothetical protein
MCHQFELLSRRPNHCCLKHAETRWHTWVTGVVNDKGNGAVGAQDIGDDPSAAMRVKIQVEVAVVKAKHVAVS